MSELRTAWFIRKRSWISLPTYTTFSASQQFPKTQKKKNKLKKKREKKNVFPKQTQGDGFDETVSSPNYIFIFIFEILGFYLFIYLIFGFLFLCFVWLVWTRMMSDYKVEMINDGMQEFYVDFHGPKESKSFLTHIFFFSFF